VRKAVYIALAAVILIAAVAAGSMLVNSLSAKIMKKIMMQLF
jgi:hypothetical protein